MRDGIFVSSESLISSNQPLYYARIELGGKHSCPNIPGRRAAVRVETHIEVVNPAMKTDRAPPLREFSLSFARGFSLPASCAKSLLRVRRN
jgi:hypothetical protein